MLLKIKSNRQAKGYSQAYMAKKLGISQNAYSKLELAYVALTVERVLGICMLLDIDFLDLLKS